MKKKRIRVGSILLLGLLLFSFSGCIRCWDKENPFKGKNIDDKIIMALEKTYPEHKFHVITSYGEEGKNKGIFADEKGLEFEVKIPTHRKYHLEVTDDYLYEILESQNFREKATKIAEQAGYKIQYEENSGRIDIEIPIKGKAPSEAEDVAQVLVDILNCVQTPEIFLANVPVYSPKYSYCTEPKFGSIVYYFSIEGGDQKSGRVYFANKDYSAEEVLEYETLEGDFILAISMNEYYQNLANKE